MSAMGVSGSGRWILVQVDVVGGQLAEAALDGAPDVLGTRAAGAIGSEGAAELRRDDDVLAPRAQRLGQSPLAPAVGIGGVEEGDAGLQGGVDDRRNRVLLHAEPEVVRAETNC